MMMKRIYRDILITLIFAIFSLFLFGCNTTTTLTETMQKSTSKDVKTRDVNHYITKDSIVYLERVKNDTVYVERMRFLNREVHDTVYQYWSYSDTVYVDKMIEKEVVKTQYKTPFYIYIIIGALIMIILYLTIKKLFH